ncbi:hypothetical protein BH10ACI3_BH10ACI3_25300 [soil metagenome]
MPLILCPECNHEVSTNAATCPNCGRPIRPEIAERKVVVVEQPREGGVPPWVFVAVGAVCIIILFIVLVVYRQSSDQANTNVNVSMAQRRAAETEQARTVTVPPSSSSQPVTMPPSQTTTTTVPGTATSVPVAPVPTKGTVVINAKVAPTTGSPQAARNTKFYLLDKDPEMILREAAIEPIEGNTLAGSLGLAAVFPDRYGDFQRRAMRAIAAHAKYSGTTGAGGSANMAGIEPEQYYLFAIVRVGKGFALWNAPITVSVGENVLNLSPQNVTEIADPNG